MMLKCRFSDASIISGFAMQYSTYWFWFIVFIQNNFQTSTVNGPSPNVYGITAILLHTFGISVECLREGKGGHNPQQR